MKKSLIIVLSMLFVLSLTASAFAVHADIPAETQAIVAKGTTQITLGGSLRMRGDYKNNLDFDDDLDDNKAAYDGRVRLKLDAQVSPNTMGRIQLESGSDIGDTYTWGSPLSQNAGTYGEGNAKRGSLYILEAWIQHTGSGLLGTPAGIKVGHMPLALGNKLFFDHTGRGDDAIMLFADPTKETHLALLGIKLTEGNTTGTDDTDAYVLLFNHVAGGFNVSGDITYLDDQDAAADGLHLWNIGLRGNTSFGAVNVKADVEIQTGKAEAPAGDTKYRGYAFLVGADYNLNDITLDAAVAMGSGDDNASDNKIETFQTAMSSTKKFTYVYDYRAQTTGVTAPNVGLGNTNTGIANTTYYKIGASAKPAKDMSAKLDLYLLKATEEVGNAAGTIKDDDIGWEVDGKVKYQIDRNLVYFIEGGILFAGDVYKLATTGGKDPDDPFVVRHGIELTF